MLEYKYNSFDIDSVKLENMLEKDKENIENVVEQIISKCTMSGKSISTAESCTGGMLGGFLTDVPGSSCVYSGGIITYTNNAKISVLGVDEQTIDFFTEVSYQTACQMAQCVMEKFKTTYGVSTTGIAGPGGGTDKNPVGTVFVGISNFKGTTVYKLNFDKEKTRKQIRELTCKFVFLKILEENLDC